MGGGGSKAPLVRYDKKVVIIGGGYAGVATAELLDPQFNVTMIERKELFVHNIAGLRQTARGEFWLSKMLIPYDKLMAHGGKVVQGEVVSVSRTSVKLASGEEIPYDYLVLAMGLTTNLMGMPGGLTGKVEIRQFYEHLSQATREAVRVAILGGGPLGVELAAEIKDAYPDKDVHLFHTGPALLSANRPPAPDNFKDAIGSKVNAKGIKVHLEDTITVGQGRIFEGRKTITSTRGFKIEVDMIFKCVGVEHDNSPLRLFWKDKTDMYGAVRVNRHLQVSGYQNVFAVGDCASTGEMKTAVAAQSHARFLAQQIVSMETGKPLDQYKISPSGWMNVPLGPFDGLGYEGAEVKQGYGVIRKFTYLAVPDWWAKLKQPPPDFSEEDKRFKQLTAQKAKK